MNNRPVTGSVSLCAEDRNENGQFRKGVSGNPGGRPKRTPAEQKAVEMMKEATPEMVELVLGIARSEKASFYAKLQAAELILNRSMGKPETYLRVENAEESVEDAAAGLLALFSSADGEGKPGRRGQALDSDSVSDSDLDSDSESDSIPAEAPHAG